MGWWVPLPGNGTAQGQCTQCRGLCASGCVPVVSGQRAVQCVVLVAAGCAVQCSVPVPGAGGSSALVAVCRACGSSLCRAGQCSVPVAAVHGAGGSVPGWWQQRVQGRAVQSAVHSPLQAAAETWHSSPGWTCGMFCQGLSPGPGSSQGPGGGNTLVATVGDSVAGGTQGIDGTAQHPVKRQSQLRSGQAANAAGLQPSGITAVVAASGLALP